MGSDEGVLVVTLLIKVVFGVICAIVANGRGRSPVAWFLLGFVLDCIGLIIVLVVPDLKVEEERRSRMMRENRRLREQMRKDRMVADARHDEHERRFAVHDRALGVDTASPRPEQLTHQRADAPGPAEQKPAPQVGEPALKQWYFADAQGRQGPVSLEILRSLWKGTSITRATYVWCEGMGEWAQIMSVPGLEESLNAS